MYMYCTLFCVQWFWIHLCTCLYIPQLLAFQKKKAKRKKKKTTNLGGTGDSSRSEAVSTSADHDSSEVAGSRSGNVSPIPFDEPGSDEVS